MNQGPWESFWQDGNKPQSSGIPRNNFGGARPRHSNAGAQGKPSSSKPNQNKQNVRGKPGAPSLVSLQSKKTKGSENVFQQSAAVNQTSRSQNPWKQVAPVHGEVLIEENLLQEHPRSQSSSSNRNQAYPQKNGPQMKGSREFPVLNFTILNKLAEPNTDASEIARKLTEKNAFGDFLESNKANLDYLELVVAALGQFCEKNGPTLFYSSFIKIVSVLEDKGIFAKMPSIIFELPRSRATNLGTKSERLSRIVVSIARLTTEMLTVLPAFSCNALGKDFIEDVNAMVNMPSVRPLDTMNISSALLDVKERLQSVWEQHSKEKTEIQKEDYRAIIRAQREELLSAMEPPDDFRMLNVMPNREDLCLDQEPFLRPNKVKGSYPDVDAYLDVQFRLLREDFFCPLREGLVAYREQIKSNKKKQVRVDNIRIYQDVTIKDYDVKTNMYTIEFSVKPLKRVNWEGSKRLIFGSLLLLSTDHFDSFLLFTVADRKPDLLAKGTFKAFYEGDALPGYATKNVMVMAESAVFFEAYRSVLIALQRVSPSHFPLEEEILCKKLDASPPKYLKDAGMPIYDLRHIRSDFSSKKNEGQIATYVQQHLAKASILDPYIRPQYDMLGLDPSQSEALYAALTRRVVVIQGPPGTGKTFLGLKIVQTLLCNKQYWAVGAKRPILAICYTNHALDQFLEGILKFTDNVVRIGSQSKCEALDRLNLREWKKRSAMAKKSSPHRRWFYEVRSQLAELRREWERCKNISQAVEKRALVDEDCLLAMNVITKEIHSKIKSTKSSSSIGRTPLPTNSALAKWLGVDSLQTLQDIFALLQSTASKSDNRAKSLPDLGNDDSVAAEDDAWEKEEIDELEGQRMPYDDIYERIYSPTDSASTSDIDGLKLPDLSLSFALSSNSFAERISELRELLPQLEDEDAAIVKRQIRELEQTMLLFQNVMDSILPIEERQMRVLLAGDLQRISMMDRWKIYAFWKSQIQDTLELKITEKERVYRQTENELKDVDTLDTAEMIRDVDVVGITTTGAAKQRALLEHLKPKIVIVEEAAEVLEAHIVTSLSASCQHLILIGDHQQLRPSTTVFKLAKDYHLDVSLFERLIMNGLKPCVLGIQHRMRPEVARLIVPTIYPRLENHESVLQYPDIRGITDSVFFLEHTEREVGDTSDADSRSRQNPYEAEMSLALAKHLLLQGYEPSKITILTTYSGQLFLLRKLRKQMGLLQGLRITVVDNFQGEENDIIILSLVRSNEDATIGFLKIENRICVALSRAKHGFYLLGNMENLKAGSKQWREIFGVLRSNGQIGKNFVLRCEVHNILINAARNQEFPPEGGCFNKCMTEMPCKHICPRICHAEDREHVQQKCREKCMRSCSVGHPCPKHCFQDCNPCSTKISKVLPCSHAQTMPCFKDPAEEFCLTQVIKELPICEHKREMDCGCDPSSVKCDELCGMLLDCRHICNLICHKKSSHEKLPCKQPCLKSCPANHQCPKKCFEDCGQCLTDVKKKLPCGHEGNLKCWILPKDAYCKVKVRKALLNCQHTAELDCSASVEGYRCTQKCGKILCNEGHVCQKRCYEPCGKCFVRVERVLDCGHSTKVECYVDQKTIRCKTPRTVVLPVCKHRVEVPCSEGEKAKCPMPCEIRLHCGHQCIKYCHVFDDPDHANYECNKPCGRKRKGCKQDHTCPKKCKDECDNCTVRVERVLPCGHRIFAECGKEDNAIFCSVQVAKQIPGCGHEIQIACSKNPSRTDCLEPCSMKLNCGHRCLKRCNEPCNYQDCTELVKISFVGLCGHKVSMPCNKYRQNLPITENEMATYLMNCPEPCKASLACEHPCRGTCGVCLNGRLHQACQEKCGRRIVCGHNCDVDCASSCPPCRKECEYRCKHSKCSKLCSDPCSACMEPCDWRCKHYKCTRKCGEMCDRPICNEPCREKLPCGHSCVGLCGEVCPPLCRICDREQLTEFVLYGFEEDDDARFVYLEDCKHCIEVQGLDHWMKMQQDPNETAEIQMKCCPRCKTIIRTSFRYGNVLKRTLNDIVVVKEKLLYTRSSSKEFADELELKIKSALQTNEKLKAELNHMISQLLNDGLNLILAKISPRKKQKKDVYPTIDDNTRYTLQVQVDVIEATLGMLQNAAKVKPNSQPATNQHFPTLSASINRMTVSMKPFLLQELLDRTTRVLHLLLNRDRFASQEHQAYLNETGRLDLLRAFYILRSAPTYESFGRTALLQQSSQLDNILVKNVKQISEAERKVIKGLLDIMAARLNTGLGISDKERQEIVRAMGLRQGHWYKCPNGHIYVITECGGAMQESTCNECGARIGGGRHTLRGDNRLASEMDGARFAAWSDVANNMGNFHL